MNDAPPVIISQLFSELYHWMLLKVAFVLPLMRNPAVVLLPL